MWMFELSGVAVAGLVVGIVTGFYLRDRAAKWERQEFASLQMRVVGVEMHYLHALRRELANLILNMGPDMMVDCYNKAYYYKNELDRFDPTGERAKADLVSSTMKFQVYEDFDIFGPRHFLPYEDGKSYSTNVDIIERYLDISKRMILRIKLKQDAYASSLIMSFDEEERRLLQETAQQVRDRKLQRGIENAMEKFRVHRAAIDGGRNAKGNFYEDTDISVLQVHEPYHPGPQYGITFKKTGEYGVYTEWLDEDRNVILTEYIRSDSTFERREDQIGIGRREITYPSG